ncbi:MAG: bifunctional nuclease family protein [Halodesulfurarchaeum sp.]
MDAHIAGVRVAGTVEGPLPVVLVGVEGESDVLPIFIGFDEAVSIARGLDARDIGRPLTHDLTLDIIEELGGRVDRVEISDLRDGTFIADLHLNTPRDEVVIDARPSDSLALVSRTDAPIAVAESVFEAGRRDEDEFEDLEDIREVADL